MLSPLKLDSSICFHDHSKTHQRPVLHICPNHSKKLSNDPVYQLQFPAPHLYNIWDFSHKYCIVHRWQNNGHKTCLKLLHQTFLHLWSICLSIKLFLFDIYFEYKTYLSYKSHMFLCRIP